MFWKKKQKQEYSLSYTMHVCVGKLGNVLFGLFICYTKSQTKFGCPVLMEILYNLVCPKRNFDTTPKGM